MLFRGRQPETSIWRRFRSGLDGFTFVREGDHYSAHIVTTAERSVDLFYVLLEHMSPAVDVAIDDRRGKKQWLGVQLALPDVRDAVSRLKVPLAAAGGLELAVYTTDDQVTLNPQLELFIYARSDRWLYLLTGLGLEERTIVGTRSWKISRHDFEPAPELTAAVESMAVRLGLHAA
jgi:hypothetical protein